LQYSHRGDASTAHFSSYEPQAPTRSPNVTYLPLADVAFDGDVDDVADAAAEDGAADRRGGGDDRQVTVAAGAGELDAGANGREEKCAALAGLGVFDLDDGAEGNGRRGGERAWAKCR
jgi:hypothetical protein